MALTTHTLTLTTQKPGTTLPLAGTWSLSVNADPPIFKDTAGGVVFAGTHKVHSDDAGTAVFTVPDTGQTGLVPADGLWRLSFRSDDNAYTLGPYVFAVTGNLKLSDLATVTGVPITPSLVQEAKDARDQAVAANTAAQTVGTTNDTVIAGRINATGSATQVALSAAIGGQVTTQTPAVIAARTRKAPRVADGIFSAVDQALASSRGTAIQVIGDSTGNADVEWVYLLTQWVAARWPTAHIRYKVFNDTIPQKYDGWTTIQAGTGGGERHAYFPTTNGRAFYLPFASIPAISGDLDLRSRVAWNYHAGVTQTLVAHRGNSAGTYGFRFEFESGNRLRLVWSPDGTTEITVLASTGMPTLTDNAEYSFRATLKLNNGAGGYTVTFYYSTDAGNTWTQIFQSVTNAGTTSVYNPPATNWTIGGYYFQSGVPAGGKIFETHIKDGIDGPTINPQPIESWIPQTASSPNVAGEFRGGPTLYVLNGSVPGADYAYLSDATRFPKIIQRFAGSLIFQSCMHNDNNLQDADYIAARSTWQDQIDARAVGSQTVLLTQNPKIIGSTTTVDLITKHARRRQMLMAWAARKGLALIDTWRAFDEYAATHGGSYTDIIQSDGLHPTQGASNTGSTLWRDEVAAAWDASSPKTP